MVTVSGRTCKLQTGAYRLQVGAYRLRAKSESWPETVTNPLHPQKISSRPLVVSFRELSYFGNPFWTDFQISLGDRLQLGAYRLQIGSSQYEVDTEVISGTTDANLFLPTRFLVVLHRFDPIIHTPPSSALQK